MKAFRMTVLVLAGLATLAAAASPKPAPKGRFQYAVGQKWAVTESMVMAGQPQMDGSTSEAMASISELSYTVEKIYPDGSALVVMTTQSCKRGTSLAGAKESPVPAALQGVCRLEAASGKSYMVQRKMTSANPEEQAMMDGNGNADEETLLRSSATTAKFLKTMRNQGPMDVVHVPARAPKIGSGPVVDGWKVTRLPDEPMAGISCEVYRAVQDPMTETVWFDAKAGRVVKRTQVTGDPATVEIIQTRKP